MLAKSRGMSKENLIEMAYNVANIFTKRSVTQNLPQMKAKEAHHSGILGKLGLSWVPSKAPGFYVNSKQVNTEKLFIN